MSEYIHKKFLSVPIYRGYLGFIASNSLDLVRKEIPDFGEGPLYAHALLTGHRGKQAYIMVVNFDNKDRELKHGCIAHEAVHLAEYLFTERGMSHDHNNPEPFTYFVEWVTDEAYKFFNQIDKCPQ